MGSRAIPQRHARGTTMPASGRWTTEVVVALLEMLSGRSKMEYAKEAQAVA